MGRLSNLKDATCPHGHHGWEAYIVSRPFGLALHRRAVDCDWCQTVHDTETRWYTRLAWFLTGAGLCWDGEVHLVEATEP